MASPVLARALSRATAPLVFGAASVVPRPGMLQVARLVGSALLSRRFLVSSATAFAAHQAPSAHAQAAPKPPGGPLASTQTPRVNIGIFGSMNVGKSSLMNLITQSNTSIVDSTPGTTADVKAALMEMHALGPAKIFDTAGLDERGLLGEKKREKSVNAAKESDVVVLVVNPRVGHSEYDMEILDVAKRREKKILVLLNEFGGDPKWSGPGYTERAEYLGLPALRVKLNQPGNMQAVVDFIESEYQRGAVKSPPLIPPRYMGPDKTVFMVVPMDAETPSGRLLRPQARVQEFCLSHYTTTVAFRLDLAAGRSKDAAAVAKERARFEAAVRAADPALVITDSQAMDLVHPWLDPAKFPNADLTTFSIVMINDLSGGRIREFADGLQQLARLRQGDKVLIAEACNHNRLSVEVCADISTCQLPRKIESMYGKDVVKVDHAFGREFPASELKDYSMVIHCGGCMVDKQKIVARIDDCKELGIPVTNFGVMLSYMASPAAAQRVLRPLAH
eukprot:tig00020516_g9962.t1